MVGWIKKHWHDPVWSKVIATAILTVLAGVGTYFLDWWPTIKEVFVAIYGFLTTKTELSNWLVGIFAAPWLVVLTAIGWHWVTRDKHPPAPSWRNYTSDNFFGIKWAWRYDETGQVSGLYSLCPHCDYQIYPKPNYSWGIDKVDFHCEACNSNLGSHQDEVAQLENKVTRHIQRKLRTGEWLSSAS